MQCNKVQRIVVIVVLINIFCLCFFSLESFATTKDFGKQIDLESSDEVNVMGENAESELKVESEATTATTPPKPTKVWVADKEKTIENKSCIDHCVVAKFNASNKYKKEVLIKVKKGKKESDWWYIYNNKKKVMVLAGKSANSFTSVLYGGHDYEGWEVLNSYQNYDIKFKVRTVNGSKKSGWVESKWKTIKVGHEKSKILSQENSYNNIVVFFVENVPVTTSIKTELKISEYYVNRSKAKRVFYARCRFANVSTINEQNLYTTGNLSYSFGNIVHHKSDPIERIRTVDMDKDFDSGYLVNSDISLYNSHHDSTTNITHERGSDAYADLNITITGTTFVPINHNCVLKNIAK